MIKRTLSYKTRLKVLSEFESLLENVIKDPIHRDNAERLLKQVREGKSWILDNYPAEQYLLDNPLIDN